MMMRFRSSGTGPERLLRGALSRAGASVRSGSELPGRPDLVLPVRKVAILVHGCFWHGCPRHYRRPRYNRAYWDRKLLRNRTRDKRVISTLRQKGWRVVVAWECEILNDQSKVLRRVLSDPRARGVRTRAQPLGEPPHSRRLTDNS